MCRGGQTCCDVGCVDTRNERPEELRRLRSALRHERRVVHQQRAADRRRAKAAPRARPGGDKCCSMGCTDTRNDPNNCGMCGVVCGMGDVAINGSCRTGRTRATAALLAAAATCAARWAAPTPRATRRTAARALSPCQPGQTCENSVVQDADDGLQRRPPRADRPRSRAAAKAASTRTRTRTTAACAAARAAPRPRARREHVRDRTTSRSIPLVNPTYLHAGRSATTRRSTSRPA